MKMGTIYRAVHNPVLCEFPLCNQSPRRIVYRVESFYLPKLDGLSFQNNAQSGIIKGIIGMKG